MTSARQRVADFWDEHIQAWLHGHDPMPEPLPAWFGSYKGSGAGVVARDGFPEPYLGGLLTDPAPRTLLLGLNPGAHVAAFQARDGIFAKETNMAHTMHGRPAAPTTDHHGQSTTAATAITALGSRSPATVCRPRPPTTATC